MSKTPYVLAGKLLCALCAALISTPALAQARTTPVTIENAPTVDVDTIRNDVRVRQSGDWNIGVLGVLDVRLAQSGLVGIDPDSNTVRLDSSGGTPLSVAQAGNWNVGILGTPGVSVANMPTVKIDATTNTVKSQQSGVWTVEVEGTSSVNVANTPNVSVSNSPTVKLDATTNTVKAQQNGTWSVGISGTPDVNVVNTPTVTTQTRHNTLAPFWTTGITVSNGSVINTQLFNCAGYKEMRIVLFTNFTGTLPYNLKVRVMHVLPNGAHDWIGQFDFDGDTMPMISAPTFDGSRAGERLLAVTYPVISDEFYLQVSNFTGVDVDFSGKSTIYLVN